MSANPTPSHGIGPVTTEAPGRADRRHVSVVLLQARNPSDPARDHEHVCFAARMGLTIEQVRCVSIFETELATLSYDDADAVLVGGAGQYSVLDAIPAVAAFNEHLAWMASSPTTAELPLFASCFGYQALVLGLGGEVIADEPRAEVGTYTLHPKSEAAGDPLFDTLPARFFAQLGHKDRASRLPAAVTDAAGSERAPHQALRVRGRPQFATQFHPELTAADNRSRFIRYMPEYGKLFGEAAATERLESHRPSPEANALLEHFTAKFVVPRANQRAADSRSTP